MNAPANQRADAARLLHRVVVRRQTTDQALAGREPSPLTLELALGSLRHFFSLSAAVDRALHRPLKPKDQDIWLLMIVGAYQLQHTRIPDHAALFETVSACNLLGKPWARGLVNAVLRKCPTSADSRDAETERSFEHPEWLQDLLRAEYPDAEAVMRANNTRAPMALRINTHRTTPDAYRRLLDDAGLASHQAVPESEDDERTGLGPESRILERPLPVADLPGYREGLVSVQDAGAQFAARLLGPAPGERVLDACAAPGGKLFHLLERHPRVRVTAVEARPKRLQQVKAEAVRLGQRDFRGLSGDATRLDWWDGSPFQYVLVDAPCSGTGTLRRHPDIKVLRQRREIDEFAELQQRLLGNLWQVLIPGGTLLYCTCSMLVAENDDVISAFLAQRLDAQVNAFRLASGRPTRFGWQLLPIDPDTDGFYYARITKATS